MGRINYSILAKKARIQKYHKLYDKNPFLTLPRLERLWRIRYGKLKTAWKKIRKNRFPVGFPDGPIINPPWFHETSHLNSQLEEVINEIRAELPDWERIQDYDKQDIIICNYDEVNRHDNCKFYDKCKLRS